MKAPSELHARRFDAARPAAVVLGGLNVTRALGLAGIPVIVASTNPREPAFASRYCRGALRLPRLDRAAALDSLMRAGEYLATSLAGRRVPLFYTNDDWQRLVQEHRALLSRHYALALNDAEIAAAVIEKDLFQPLAAARGLPIPRMLEWEALEHFERAVVIKPRTKFDWHVSPVFVRLFGREGKACVFASGRALLADTAARELRDQLLIQEYVEGDDRQIWSFHGFCDETGVLLDCFVGRKIRTYPALTGMSSYLELAYDEDVAEVGRRIVSGLGLKGVFKIDLKRDALNGRLRLLEVNARYNLWHYLGAANGVNLPAVAYHYLVHGARPAGAARYGTTCRWLYLRYDWKAYRELAGRGELGFVRWLRSLAATPLVYQLWAWNDPLPLFDLLGRRLKSRLARLAARLASGLNTRLRRWRSTAS
jgi:predicted ATP-grasp superfamily ATP-dependent carboligase